MPALLVTLVMLGKPLQECPFGSDERLALGVLADFLGVPWCAVTVRDVKAVEPGTFQIRAVVAKLEGYEQEVDVSGEVEARVSLRGGYVEECSWLPRLYPGSQAWLDGPPWPEPWGEIIEKMRRFVKARIPSFSGRNWPIRPWLHKPVFLTFRVSEEKAGPAGIELSALEEYGPDMSPRVATGRRVVLHVTLPELHADWWKLEGASFADMSEVRVDAERAVAIALAKAKEQGWDKEAEGPLQVDTRTISLALGHEPVPCWTVWLRLPRTFRGWVTRQGKRVYVEEPTFEQRGVRIDAITGEVLGIYPRDAFKDPATEAQQGPDDASE